MTLPNYQTFDDLKATGLQECKVKIQIFRKWKDYVLHEGHEPGLNVIVVDENEKRMHIWILPLLMSRFCNNLQDGQMMVQDIYSGVIILSDTSFTKLYFNHDIPRVQELRESLKDVPSFINDENSFLIDIAGTVQTSSPRCVSSKDDNTKSHVKLLCVMADVSNIVWSRDEVNVTLFNKFGKDFEAQIKNYEEEHVVVILASAKVNKYEGFITIILPDEEVQKITGNDVYELENQMRESGDEKKFPQILRDLQGKEYFITLCPTEDNIKEQSNVYVAKLISHPLHVVITQMMLQVHKFRNCPATQETRSYLNRTNQYLTDQYLYWTSGLKGYQYLCYQEINIRR
ncbi:hypothetical protein AgCh_016114 [Apium graveolens]